MASPESGQFAVTPNNNNNNSSIRVLNLKSPLSDETIWNRLREAGFDEESIKRRDKGSLIAHIAKLEAEVFTKFIYIYIYLFIIIFFTLIRFLIFPLMYSNYCVLIVIYQLIDESNMAVKESFN